MSSNKIKYIIRYCNPAKSAAGLGLEDFHVLWQKFVVINIELATIGLLLQWREAALHASRHHVLGSTRF